jgi:hypothetical protein
MKKITNGVFTPIIETSSRKSSFECFINNIGNENGPLLNSLLEQYKEHIYEHEELFNQLAYLEELIIQIKIRENMDDIKLFIVRDYIYARTTFFTKEKERSEIRTIVDRLDKYPDKTIEDLNKDTFFMSMVSKKLKTMMDIEIEKNVKVVSEV